MIFILLRILQAVLLYADWLSSGRCVRHKKNTQLSTHILLVKLANTGSGGMEISRSPDIFSLLNIHLQHTVLSLAVC